MIPVTNPAARPATTGFANAKTPRMIVPIPYARIQTQPLGVDLTEPGAELGSNMTIVLGWCRSDRSGSRRRHGARPEEACFSDQDERIFGTIRRLEGRHEERL